MTNRIDQARKAPNAKTLNTILNDDEAAINSAPRLWTFQVGGQAMGFPESFEDVRDRVCAYLKETSA